MLQGNQPTMLMFSEAQGDRFVETKRGPEGTLRTLARFPGVDHTWLPWQQGLDIQVAWHRDRIAKLAPRDAWRRCETTDDAIALLRRLRAANVAWRKSQPADGLLDLDLRAVLRQHYEHYEAGIREVLANAAP